MARNPKLNKSIYGSLFQAKQTPKPKPPGTIQVPRGIDIPVGDVGFMPRPEPDEQPDIGFTPRPEPDEQQRDNPWALGKLQEGLSLMDNVPPSIWERYDDGTLYVFNQLGNQTKQQQTFENDLSLVKQGLSLDEIQREQERQALLKKAGELAQTTAHIDNKRFDELRAMIAGEMNSPVAMPGKPELQDPSLLSMIAGTAGAFLTPEHAFDVGAAPFVNKLKQQGEDYQRELERYEREREDKGNRIKLLMDELQLQNQRDVQEQNALDSSLQRQSQHIQNELNRLNNAEIQGDKLDARLNEILLKIDSDKEKELVKQQMKAYNDGDSLETRHNAWQYLNYHYPELKLKEPTQATMDEVLKGARAGYYDARTDTENQLRDEKEKLLISQYGLNNSRAKEIVKRIGWMDRLNTVKVAEGWKRIDNMNSMINDRSVRQQQGWQRLAQQAWASSQSSINTTLSTLSAQKNTVTTNLRALEKEYYSKTWLSSENEQFQQALAEFERTGKPPKNGGPRFDLWFKIRGYESQLDGLNKEITTFKSAADNVSKTLQEQGAVNQTTKPGTVQRSTPKVSGDWRKLKSFAEQNGFEVSSTTGGKHNEGSLHYRGLAIDVRTRGKSPQEIDAFMEKAIAAGFGVRDERTHPPGQKVWGGPHLHLTILPAKGNGNNSKNNKNGAGNSKTVNVPGLGNIKVERVKK